MSDHATPAAPIDGNDEEDNERYSLRCPACGASTSPGHALRGGRIICTCCGDEVPLPGAAGAP
jgi:hypothetical protein